MLPPICFSLLSNFPSAPLQEPWLQVGRSVYFLMPTSWPRVVALVFPPSEGQMYPHTISKECPVHNLLSPRSYQETHKGPSTPKLSAHFSALSFWVLLFFPIVDGKNLATSPPRASLTGGVLFPQDKWSMKPSFLIIQTHSPVNGSSAIHNASKANCAV